MLKGKLLGLHGAALWAILAHHWTSTAQPRNVLGSSYQEILLTSLFNELGELGRGLLTHYPNLEEGQYGTRKDKTGVPALLLCHSQVAALASSRTDLSPSAGSLQLEHRRDLEHKRRDFTSCGNKKLYFGTHALVCLLEENGFPTQQAGITASALVKIMDTNMDIVYKDMVTKMQQEIAVQQIMPQIANVKKGIILEKSEFSALRAENEKINLKLHQLRQVMDEVTKVQTDTKLDFNLEKSTVQELYSLNERKLLEMRTEMVSLHAQQDRAVTQTNRKIDTEVTGLKTMLESHKLDNIKYLAGSVFTCLTVALGFYHLWI
ncbi:mitochondrial calcium uniporter regulator 1-like [Mirounga angustirostris]|uniref:mitochondrial calcium uniporter regulator 1-like n=1 Tax=Mirounga angustirostris TaxID=9716 RepID=UPI001E6870A9|nr:mitochondrial calcium uniporter regulator 1-like [Mirounga angustirostris]